MDEREERSANHGERIAEGDKIDVPLGSVVDHSGRENSVASWHKTVMLRHPLRANRLRATSKREIDEVNGVELRDRKVLVHELDVAT